MPSMNVLIKPASGSCNLRCKYCFYTDEMSNRETPDYGQMSLKTLEVVVKKTIEAAEYSVTFAFQGGEPMLSGLQFYQHFCVLKEKYNVKNLQINCIIQTNGILINQEWAAFFAKENFLVGISLDGMRPIHDRYRVDTKGEGTFKRVMRATRLLQDANVEFNILTVLTEDTAKDIERIYNFLVFKNFLYQQYIPCLNPLAEEPEQQTYSLTVSTYEQALKQLFDLWYQDYVEGIHVYNRYFENLIGILTGYEPESCDMRGHCSIQYVIEADGGVFPCDFYALDQYCIGNIRTNSFQEIDQKRKEIGFVEQSLSMYEECLECEWKKICRGGCRRNREILSGGQLGVNRFCSAYKGFFAYAIKKLQYLANSIR